MRRRDLLAGALAFAAAPAAARPPLVGIDNSRLLLARVTETQRALRDLAVFRARLARGSATADDGADFGPLAGKDVLFDVDWQGTQQLRQNARDDLASIFILPPSVEELERRLYARAQDPEDVVKRRMAKATSEMSHWAEYDYIIVNEEIPLSVAEAEAILAAERLKRERRVGLAEWLRGMGVGQ